MQYIYLSYPKHDGEFALRLVDDLQSAGYLLCMDAVSEPGSMAWAAETRRAIRGSGVVILILTPEQGRRTGIRLEGIGAKRRKKPLIVIRRSPGALPRYVQDAAILDGTGPYEALWESLLPLLPSPAALIAAPPPNIRPMRRPPRQPADALRRRRLLIAVLAIVAALLLLTWWVVIPG